MEGQDLQHLGLPLNMTGMTMVPMDSTPGGHITTLNVVPGELISVQASSSQTLTSMNMSSMTLSNLVQVSDTASMAPFSFNNVMTHEDDLDKKAHGTFGVLQNIRGEVVVGEKQSSQENEYVTEVFEDQSIEEGTQLILNKRNIFAADANFWDNFSHPAYADIDLVFQDGILSVNRAGLAAFSEVVAETGMENVDAIVIPDLKKHTFKDLIFLFTTDDTGLLIPTDDTALLIQILGVKIFQSSSSFTDSINRQNKVYRTSENTTPKEIHDPFAPGYASKSQNLPAEAIKIEKNTVLEDQTKNPNDPDYDSFIDDDEAESEEDFWDDMGFDYTPGKNKSKKQNKSPDQHAKIHNEKCVELLLLKNEHYICHEATLDIVVSPFLKCHDCHQVGYTSLRDLINHMRTTHQWHHKLIHCIYCDLPFMEKNKCIKHEIDGCKNVKNACYKCGENLSSKYELLDHLIKGHNHGVKRRCPHCENDYLTLMPHNVNKWPHIDKCYNLKHETKKSNPVGRPKGSKTGLSGKKICDDCGGTFRDSWKHRRQCTALNKDIKYVCHECKKGFRRLGAVKKHFKLSNKCKLNSQNQKEYQKLMKYVENNIKGKTVCQDCGCEYVTRKGPQEHRKNCSTYTQFKCFACNRGINAMDGFHIHFSKFPECRSAPENSEIVAEIVARSQKPEFHVCYLCGAQYKAKESIEKHMLTHSETVEYYMCRHPECGKKFITQKALDMHLKNHTMPKVICSICGKQVKQGSMPLHMILHTGKKIECNLCGKMFQHKGVLNKHIRTIHDEKKPPRNQKEKKKKPKKATVNNVRLIQNKDIQLMQPQGQIQTIQVQLETGDGNQPQTVRVSIPPVSLGQNLPHGVRVSLPDELQTVTVVSQANGISGAQPLQGYQQNVMIPNVPPHVLGTTNIQQLFQTNQLLSGQPRYQS